ncbi:MAG TPA: diguanylate cyclase [Thermoanaerobaculia bacterium]|jgi:diguanylate cyclase (GGDEF)-like protein|nr:diguanylate cyclase [Thermoanaerobaculia bacterium]
MGAVASVEEKIRALRDRFVSGLGDRIAEIDQELAQMAGNGSAAVLERKFHTLAGTAGTYGLERVAELAAEGEEICCDQIVDQTATQALHAIVADLRAAIAAEATPPSLKLVPPHDPMEEPMAEATRILCVEDDTDQAAYLTTILEDAGYQTAWTGDAAQFETAFGSFRPDLVILDINLPDASGIDLARLVRNSPASATVPILFLTRDRALATQLEGLRAGGDDYLTKPVSAALLLTTVETRLERARLMRSLIDTDGLTGLLTHAAFERELEKAVMERARGEGAFTLVTIDIDRFKSINDSHGHATGDRALAALGSLLRRSVRRTDAVGRCGGDELAILLRHAGADAAEHLANEVLERCITMSRKVPFTFSSGVAELRGDEKLELWKERADEAMYAAKHAGRARVVVSS